MIGTGQSIRKIDDDTDSSVVLDHTHYEIHAGMNIELNKQKGK